MRQPPAAAEPPRLDPYASLAIGAFRRFMVSLLSMTMATQVQAVVVGWLV